MGESMQSEQVAEQVRAMVASFGADWPRLRLTASRVVWAVDPDAGVFIAPTMASFHAAFTDPDDRRVREALHMLVTACGVEEGAEIGRPLRAAILAGLDLVEPALPAWVRPGAYAFSQWHGARGINKRIVATGAGGVRLAGRVEPLEAGLFLAAWEPAREERPEGLPCSTCGLERDWLGLCNGCVEPLRAACLEALHGCDGYSRRVDLAGGSIDSFLSLIVTARWERSCGPARIVVSSGIGADSFRVECDDINFAADMFADLVVSAATGRRPAPQPAIVDGFATRDIKAGEVLTLSLDEIGALHGLRRDLPTTAASPVRVDHYNTGTWPPALSFGGIVAPPPPADGDGDHYGAVLGTRVTALAASSINPEPPTQRTGPPAEPSPRVTTALGTEWTTYGSLDEAVAAAARRGEST